MKTLHRYILTQQIPPFLFGIFIIIFILILDFLYKNLEMLIGKGVPIRAAAELLLLSLGWMIVMAVPMAVLIGTLIAFMRLASDNEIVAMHTSGLSLTSISKPVLVAAVVLSFAMIPVHNYVVPETNHRLANLLVSIQKKKPALQLRAGVFMNEIKGYSILVNKSMGNKIEGVTISRLIEGKPAQTIRAERGELHFADDGNTLVMKLYNGEIHDVDEKDPKRYLSLKFTEHTLNIPGVGRELVRVDREYRGDREMSIGMLRSQIKEYRGKLDTETAQVESLVVHNADALPAMVASAKAGQADEKKGIVASMTSTGEKMKTLKAEADSYRRRMRSLAVEAHKKVALSFACLVFVLIGIPIGVRTKDGSAGSGIVVSTLFFAIYYAFLNSGEKLADRGYVLPSMSMWAANIVLGAVGLYLFIRADRELPFVPRRLRSLVRGKSS
jgi:lipopolysaccharide export system permease protein